MSGGGNIGSSANVNVASGANYDVSATTATYTLGGSQTLLGSGTVTGAVATASSGSSIVPAVVGVAGTLTFKNSLNLNSGATVYLDLSTSHFSGNDQIAVGGNLTLGSSDTFHINALSGAANLDQTADYVLFTGAGTTTMSGQPALVFDGTPPGNSSSYSVQKSGNNVVLHYSASLSPTVTSVVVTNTLDGSTVATRGETVTFSATVSAGGGVITNVRVNLSAMGGSSSQVMNNLGGGNYSFTTTVGSSARVGSDSVGVTATDTTPLSGSLTASLTVNASTETWNGLAANNNWSSGTNWVSTAPPGFSSDTLIFAGSTNILPNMNNNYEVAGLTFDGTAANFTIASTTSSTLTLDGNVENDSSYLQTLNVPVVLNGTETINDAAGTGITLGSAVSGSGGLTVVNGTVTLYGANSYAGDTTVSGGILKVGSSAAIPNGSGKGNVSLAGTLDLNGTNATVNGLSGSGTVDNTSATNASTLTIGNLNQSSSLSGVVQNSGGTNLALVKVGTGSLTLSGANTYAGGTTLNAGTLLIGNNAALGTGSATLAGGTFENSGNVVITNNIIVQNNTTNIIDNGAPSNLEIDGNISGGGTITRGASQTDTLYLGGDNSGFAGTYQDQNSASSITRWTTNTAGSASARWIFNQAANLTRTTMQFASGTISFGSISGGGFVSENGAGQSSIIQVGALGFNDTFTGSFQANGGSIAVTKVGTGTLMLIGANNYSGPTIVSNGALVISTIFAGSSDFTVNDGKSLSVTNTGGSTSATMASLTLGNGGTTTLGFINVTNLVTPLITSAGGLTNNDATTIVITGTNGLVGGNTYPLITANGGISGASHFTLSLPAGVAGSLVTNVNTIALTIVSSVSTNPTNISTCLVSSDGAGWRDGAT